MEGNRGDQSDVWELSKENVQPLKTGRKFSNLTAALQPHQPSFFEEKRSFKGPNILIEYQNYNGPYLTNGMWRIRPSNSNSDSGISNTDNILL